MVIPADRAQATHGTAIRTAKFGLVDLIVDDKVTPGNTSEKDFHVKLFLQDQHNNPGNDGCDFVVIFRPLFFNRPSSHSRTATRHPTNLDFWNCSRSLSTRIYTSHPSILSPYPLTCCALSTGKRHSSPDLAPGGPVREKKIKQPKSLRTFLQTEFRP